MKKELSVDTATIKKKDTFFAKLWEQRAWVMMSFPFIVYVIIFRYLPIGGWVLAFQNYWPAKSLFDQTWVGLENFRMLFNDPVFFQVLRNTIAISAIKLTLGMFFAILLALILNEVRNLRFKKITQTISYLPYFISWVVAANLVRDLLATDGIINEILMALNIVDKPIMFLGVPKLFWWIIGFSHVWKQIGWDAIVYLAAMTSINPNLYEAAMIDGASRLQRIRHVTLPALRPTIVILLILNIGQLMNAGFEQVYLLQNGRVIEYARIFEIFELDFGLKMMRYSFATAAGIFRSVVSIILVFSANYIAKRLDQERLF